MQQRFFPLWREGVDSKNLACRKKGCKSHCASTLFRLLLLPDHEETPVGLSGGLFAFVEEISIFVLVRGIWSFRELLKVILVMGERELIPDIHSRSGANIRCTVKYRSILITIDCEI